ncbi:MAG: hypothetical protein ACOC2H_08025 [Spirochaetota bacterium]
MKFVGINPDSITFMDESLLSDDNNRLVQIEDVSDTSLETFGSTGSGTNQFGFLISDGL